MQQLQYLVTGSTEPEYNLAFEEYVLNHCTDGDYLILWQNRNAVIIGRNQNTAEEIDQTFVDTHGIHVVRRNTGGGAVYHDMGNLNYSFITDAPAPGEEAKMHFIQPVVRALQQLGLDAQTSGRNDILVSGRKVSGTAQQISKGRILHHGTLLFDSDPSMISGALTPDPTKFQSKSVKSVRSRVGNIRQFLARDMDIHAFWAHLISSLSENGMVPAVLPEEAYGEIARLKAEKYDTWDWNYGRSPQYEIRVRNRFSGGLLEILLSVKEGRIATIRFYGDFLAVSPVSILEEALLGCPYRRETIADVLASAPVEACLGGITREECLKTILNEN